MNLNFSVEFYETAAGACPVREFLDQLKQSDPDDCAAVLAGLAKLRDRQYHRPPLSKSLEHGLLELRHVGRLNTRVIYFFARGRRIIVVHGIRSKAQKMPANALDTARARMRDWLSRNQ
ncbi:MAG: type II toxin-antitoxin system RelE/ParE family toxin [Candidatus Hydrogenedentes bacterium]|nr:type II toxin-antitoxin system RelE/ParE family toxin [Candidatus Hydrogenedentota bacterium]